ncbi:DNA-3-methyladenine glycosylase III [Methanococcus maripaludis C5]|uniref:DNA-3-methyladenine glycosylase III n=1 Tax=Methanococcus maripaludis (strain C5 / ATCC BAA-1333) TaxID=402880 RepID=A4FYP3_METM5|nr:endonuclease III [Methanococcus maripaludis]ABO35327.1 DNA-3-methyladenine glycosylase III [Methanococcus maripaludis C5]
MEDKEILQKIYDYLFELYGPQGWWPLLEFDGCNPTKTGSVNGYHPNNYEYPKTKNQCFEICIGAILTQNTSWPSVEKSLKNLRNLIEIKPENIINLDIELLKEAIKPSGYYNQKSERLKGFSKYFIELKNTPTSEELLKLKGVGPETADSMLLYAFKVPSFVIDAYTKRILFNLNLIKNNEKYDKIKELFEENIPKNLEMYQEYHALLVEHAKNYYRKKENYYKCPLLKIIK